MNTILEVAREAGAIDQPGIPHLGVEPYVTMTEAAVERFAALLQQRREPVCKTCGEGAGDSAAPADQWNEAIEAGIAICEKERDEYMPQAAKNDGRQSDMAFGSVNTADRIAEALKALAHPAPTDEQPCKVCGGDGILASSECGFCDGTGHGVSDWSISLEENRTDKESLPVAASQPVAQHPAQELPPLPKPQAVGVWGCMEPQHYTADQMREYARLSRAQSAAPAAGMTDEQIKSAVLSVCKEMYGESDPEYTDQDAEFYGKVFCALFSAAPAAAPDHPYLKYVIVHRPGMVPDRKGGFRDKKFVEDMLRSLYELYPDCVCDVIEMPFDCYPQSGREWIAMYGDKRRKPLPDHVPAPQPVAAQVGEIVSATGSLNDLAVIKWTGDYCPQIGDLIYAAHPQAAQDKGGDK